MATTSRIRGTAATILLAALVACGQPRPAIQWDPGGGPTDAEKRHDLHVVSGHDRPDR